MNTLDSILPELRSLLPVSLRGAYLDGYLQRRRTPMELLLSRSLPNAKVSASTFDDVRSEIRSLGMHPTDEIPYLHEIEQALAVGRDTRPVVARAVAFQQRLEAPGSTTPDRRYHVVVVNERTGEKHVVSRPEEPLTHAEGVTFLSKMSNRPGRRNQLEEVSSAQPDETCHVCSETGKKSCTACGTELMYMGAHGEGCPRCAEQEMDVLDAQNASGAVSEEDVTERVASDITYAARSSKLAAGVAEAKALTPAREAVLDKLNGRRLGFVSNAVIYDEGMRDLSKTEHKIALGLVLGGQLRVLKVLGALPGTHARSRIGADGPSHYVLRRAAQIKAARFEAPASTPQESHDEGMAKRERYRQQVQAIGLPFDEDNVLMTAVDRALVFGQDADAIIARARESMLHDASAKRLPSVDEMSSRWMSGDHVIGPNGENGTIVRLEDRGEHGWHLKLDRPPGAHWQSAVGFRRISGHIHEPPPVPPESPETPLHQQDRHSVDVLDRLVAALSQVFIVTPIRSGHGYRVVDLRSSVDFGVYKGLPRNTYLTTVSLRHSGPSEIIGDKAYLVQATREAGLSHDQYRAIRQFVAETVERLTDEAQGKAPPEPEMPDDGEVTTKTFATRMPTKYLRDFFAEKDIPEQHWTLQDSSGMEHHISNLVVVEHIAQTNKTEADAIANTLRRLDFANQDINGYLKHLAHALIEHKVSSVQDTQDPPVTPASELRMSINHVASVSRR